MMNNPPVTSEVLLLESIGTPFLPVVGVVWTVIALGVSFLLSDRDQRQAEVAHLREQAVQRGLVDDGTMEEGRAVAVVGEGQPVKPGGPAGAEAPLDADLVPTGVVRVDG